MQPRNIGIVGYAGVFPVSALLLAILFYRATPRELESFQITKPPLWRDRSGV
jgi:hypothetical protein